MCFYCLKSYKWDFKVYLSILGVRGNLIFQSWDLYSTQMDFASFYFFCLQMRAGGLSNNLTFPSPCTPLPCNGLEAKSKNIKSVCISTLFICRI